jgi:hypothetical protein
MEAWGHDPIEGLAIATNKRTVSFGAPRPPIAEDENPPFTTLTEQDRLRHVGVGITGRADSTLHQLSLRIQVRNEG